MAKVRARSIVSWSVLAAALLFAVATSAVGILWDSATADEPIHATAAWTNLETGRFLLNLEHPPLPKLLEGLALDRIVAEDFEPSFSYAGLPDYRERFVHGAADSVRTVLAAARWPTVVFLLGTILLAFRLGETLRAGTGPLAALLAATSPLLLAHGRLATTDAAWTAGVLASVLGFRRIRERGDLAGVAAAGTGLFVALASKYAAVVLPPLVLLVALVPPNSAPVGLDDEAPAFRPGLRRRAAAAFAALGLAVALLSALLAIYDRASSPRDREILRRIYLGQPAELPAPLALAESIDPPLASWLTGLEQVLRLSRHGRLSWLDGEIGERGWPAYHPLALAAKTPAATVALVLASLLSLLRAPPTKDELPLLLAATWLLAFAMGSRFAIGARHVLPVQILLLVFVAGRLPLLHERLAGHGGHGGLAARRRTADAVVGLLLAGSLLPAIVSFPAPVGWLSFWADRALDRPPLLLDSNLDWGQDLWRARAELARRGVPDRSIDVAYFGGAAPEHELPGSRNLLSSPAGWPHEPRPWLLLSRHLRWMGPEWAVRTPRHAAAAATLELVRRCTAGDTVASGVRCRRVAVAGNSIEIWAVTRDAGARNATAPVTRSERPPPGADQ